ncbi:BON domain-containing protein [Microvirga massiliensis]|uniref:BON domain-containing protein n=1 Tax=Microvirga massiliensis TaxID=1033741 RepID=UPI00093FC90A|nr:BON domain-containing protein [Microvirga massiliensis]
MADVARKDGTSDKQNPDPAVSGRESHRRRHARHDPGDTDQSVTGAGHHRGRGPKGFTRSDDRIRGDVCERLTEDPHIDASDIEVVVEDGTVTLVGSIKSRSVTHYVEDIIERISGVRRVQNNLRIQQRAGVLMGAGRTTGRSGGRTGGGSTPTILKGNGSGLLRRR